MGFQTYRQRFINNNPALQQLNTLSSQMLDLKSPYYQDLGQQLRGNVGRQSSDMLWQRGLQAERQGYMTGVPEFAKFQTAGASREIMTNAQEQIAQQMSGLMQRGVGMGMSGLGQAGQMYGAINQQAAQMAAQDEQNKWGKILGIGGLAANFLAPGLGGLLGYFGTQEADRSGSPWQAMLGGWGNRWTATPGQGGG